MTPQAWRHASPKSELNQAISRIISRQNWPQNGESTNLKISLIRVLHQRRLRHQSELRIDWMVIASSSRSGTMRKKFPIIRIEDAWKKFSKQLGGFMEIRHSKNRNARFIFGLHYKRHSNHVSKRS